VERGFVLRVLFQQLITLLLFYFLMSIWWGEEQWFQDKVKELSFFLGVGGLFFLASLGTSLITRPVTIQIQQENKHFNRNETTFSITGNVKTQEHERIVDLKINIIKSKSIWGWLVCYILKKLDVTVQVEPVTPGIILEADNEYLRTDVTGTEKGFLINIGDYLERILRRSNPSDHMKGCEYVISEDRGNVVSNEKLHITPILLAKDKIAPYIVTILVRFDNPSHTVHFKWE
jgi:hypothetical protein